jgi:hypothetical protein
LLAILSLVLSGCEKKKDEAPEAPKATEPAAAPAEAAKPAVAEGDVAEAAKAATEAAKAMGAGDAPEVMKKMAEHMKGINTAIKENMADCKKAAAEADKYIKANQADFEAFQKYADGVPDAEKAKMALQFQALIAPLMQDYMATQMQFAQKCANEAKALAEMMKKMKTK